MAIDRSFTRLLAAWVSIIAILLVVDFNVVRCHAPAPDLADDPALYPVATDSNDPLTLPDQGSVISASTAASSTLRSSPSPQAAATVWP